MTRIKLQNEELKDAYKMWLKDLHDDNPENLLHKLNKKHKHGGKRRSRRELRARHAQQHTASSALRDVTVTKDEKARIPSILAPIDKQVVANAQKRRHQVLVDEANYAAAQYSSQPSWRPGLAFFQKLVAQVLQKISPDTDGGVVSTELHDFPVNIAPLLFRVPVRHRTLHEHRLGVALLFCQEQNQEQRVQGSDTNDATQIFALHVRVYLQENRWREHRDMLLQIISNTSAEISAVRKRATNIESRHNDLRLLKSRQEVEQAIDELWADTSNEYDQDLLAIQKYIPFKGASAGVSSSSSSASAIGTNERKAWIARCAFRKRDKHSSMVWIISGGQFATDSSSDDCQLVKCNMDQAWSEPRFLTSTCALALEKALHLRFNELVVDLLQDLSGDWWLLQVKAFTLSSTRPLSAVTTSSASTPSLLSKNGQKGLSRTQSAPTRFETGLLTNTQWKKWRCAGRYCVTGCVNKKLSELTNSHKSCDDDESDGKEPSGYLTKKVLRSCEFYDDFVQQQDMSLAGGFTEFPAALAFHIQHRLPKRDRSQLYEAQPLCNPCLRRYHSLRQQWMETVEVPKTASSHSIAARHKRILPHTTSLSENADHVLLPPNKLPSLNHDPIVPSSLNASFSTPALPALNRGINKKSLYKQDNRIEDVKSTYFAELAAMEEMLAQHEPPSITSTCKSSNAARNQLSGQLATPLRPVQEERDDIFPKWNGVTRIEEMWQNLALKPLDRKSEAGVDINHSDGARQKYNSVSLQQELKKLADVEADNNRENDQQEMPTTEAELDDKIIPAVGLSRSNRVAATRTIHVQHCRQVFEDEMYREQLVSKAVDELHSGNQEVYFVVVPQSSSSASASSNQKCSINDEQQELVEMALRSLYLDVKQTLASSIDTTQSVPLSSWPLRPRIFCEASGCVTVKLGPT